MKCMKCKEAEWLFSLNPASRTRSFISMGILLFVYVSHNLITTFVSRISDYDGVPLTAGH